MKDEESERLDLSFVYKDRLGLLFKDCKNDGNPLKGKMKKDRIYNLSFIRRVKACLELFRPRVGIPKKGKMGTIL